MARLFNVSREEDLIEDIATNAEGQVAQDGPVSNKEDLVDVVAEPECCDDNKEEIIEIKEAVEEAVEVQDEVEEVIENNDEALESDPESVTEEQVVEAQECLIASLARLGMNKQQRANFKVSFESYASPADKLRAVNKQLKACNKHIRHTVSAATSRALELAVKNNSRLNVSREYTAVD